MFGNVWCGSGVCVCVCVIWSFCTFLIYFPFLFIAVVNLPFFAFLPVLTIPSPSLLSSFHILFPHRGTEGSYLVRRSERVHGEFALSLRSGGAVNHYRLIQMEDDQIAMVDVVNGNRIFASMQSLLAFYKLLPPEAIGGLAGRLAICVVP